MSKKQPHCTLESCCHRAAKRFRQPQKHLYLIVDDWERGYSVYKINVDAFDAGAGPESIPFPDPPVVRFEARHGGSWYFAAHGTRILAMQPSGCPAFPTFDTQTMALTVCSWPRRGGNKLLLKPFFASVSGNLFLLRGCHFDVLSATPPPPDSTSGADAVWSWSRVRSLPPFDDSNRISSFALHPDGRTLFISQDKNTFSFDTESQEWASHGNWFMPFQGEAYFDSELDAWVGLCCHKGGVGYICSCDVAPIAADFRSLPAWKLGKDQLFNAESRSHLGATLVYMGNTKYCLIESLAHDNEEDLRRLHWDGYYPHRRVLSITTFGLKYDKQGQLMTTQRKVQTYEMADAHQLPEPSWKPVAFWMSMVEEAEHLQMRRRFDRFWIIVHDDFSSVYGTLEGLCNAKRKLKSSEVAIHGNSAVLHWHKAHASFASMVYIREKTHGGAALLDFECSPLMPSFMERRN